jgi:hypothetical protein
MGPARIRESVTILGHPGALVIILNAARLARAVLDTIADRYGPGWTWQDMEITVGEPDPAGTAELLRRLAAVLNLTPEEQDDIREHVLRDLRVSIDPGHGHGCGPEVPPPREGCTGRECQPA